MLEQRRSAHKMAVAVAVEPSQHSRMCCAARDPIDPLSCALSPGLGPSP
jgi:hypothetical protein